MAVQFKVPGTTEVGVTGSTAVKYTEKDFPCYEDLIYYCDPAIGDSTRYNTGSVSFFIKEKE